MRGIPGRAGISDIVEQRQNKEPDDVHEVPIESDIVERDMVGRSEAAGKKLAEKAPEDKQNADRHMEAVETSDDKKAGAINAACVEPESFVMKVPPFIALEADEQGAKGNRHEKPTEAGFSFQNRNLTHVKCATARNEEDGIDRGEQKREVGDIRTRRPSMACLPWETILRPAEDKISAKKPSEEHAFGNQKHDHPEFRCGWRCTVVLLGIVSEDCCGHGYGWFYLEKSHGLIKGPRRFMSIRTSAEREIAKSQRKIITIAFRERPFFIYAWRQEGRGEAAGR